MLKKNVIKITIFRLNTSNPHSYQRIYITHLSSLKWYSPIRTNWFGRSELKENILMLARKNPDWCIFTFNIIFLFFLYSDSNKLLLFVSFLPQSLLKSNQSSWRAANVTVAARRQSSWSLFQTCLKLLTLTQLTKRIWRTTMTLLFPGSVR